eukprot:7211824-Pyramimonas_sp.AAC.1
MGTAHGRKIHVAYYASHLGLLTCPGRTDQLERRGHPLGASASEHSEGTPESAADELLASQFEPGAEPSADAGAGTGLVEI